MSLKVNEVDIALGSTAYLEAQPGGEMALSVVEGQGTVSAFGTTVVVSAGARTRIPLNATGVASGPPSNPEPYDDAALKTLPLQLLPQSVTVARPATVSERRTPSAEAGGLPASGTWSASVSSPNCPSNPQSVNITLTFRADESGSGLIMGGQTGFGASGTSEVTFDQTSPGVYLHDWGQGTKDALTVLAGDHVQMQETYSLQGSCVWNFDFTLVQSGS